MDVRKKILIFSIVALLIVMLMVVRVIILRVILPIQNPLRRSEEEIKEDILVLTPLGMNMENVIKVIENQSEWKVEWIDYEDGYMRPSDDKVIGKKSLRVSIGEYENFFVTYVTVLWGFDENSKLIDIYVWKVTDAW